MTERKQLICPECKEEVPWGYYCPKCGKQVGDVPPLGAGSTYHRESHGKGPSWRDILISVGVGAALVSGLVSYLPSSTLFNFAAAWPTPAALLSALSQPTPGIATTASPSLPVRPTSTPFPTMGAIPTPSVPTWLVVANTAGQGVYLRTAPAGERTRAWPESAPLMWLGKRQWAEEESWLHVQDQTGALGWVPEKYVVARPSSPPTADRAKYHLELLAGRGNKDAYGATVDGQVKNISNDTLKSVQVVIEWYTADMKFVSSDVGMLTFDPLLPGQVSPFKIISRANPEKEKFTVNFKQVTGGMIPALDSRPK